MIATVMAPILARRGIHYGWVMVAITFFTMLATAAAMGIPGVLMLPLKGEFGWDTGAISGALALRLLMFGAMGPFAAVLMQIHGVRRIIVAALGLIVTGLLLTTQTQSLWQLWITWGVLVGAGTGMTAIVLGATVASRWFTTRRGLVLGLLTASAATGQLMFLPFAAWLADRYGWRAAVLGPVGACGFAALLMLLAGADTPGDVGQTPYGEPATTPAMRPAEAEPVLSGNTVALAFGVLHAAASRRMFWLLGGSFAVCGFTTNGLVQSHFIPLCVESGLTAMAGAGVLALMGGFDFVGTILAGWLSDRFASRWLLFWFYGLRGVALLLLPFSDFSLLGLSLFAVFYGMDWIATVAPTVKLAAGAFGRNAAPLVFGWIFTAHQLGSAIAALGAGLARDAWASYLPAFTVGGVLCVLTALAMLVARPRPDAALSLSPGARAL